MSIELNIKLIFAILAGIITIISYFPYIRDIILKKTRPHAYTWLIWGITQGMAAYAVIFGGGGFGSIAFILGTILVILIFILSFKYGYKDITKNDTLMLFSSLLAIMFWLLFKIPYISILLVTIIDVIGYIPTIRKTYD